MTAEAEAVTRTRSSIAVVQRIRQVIKTPVSSQLQHGSHTFQVAARQPHTLLDGLCQLSGTHPQKRTPLLHNLASCKGALGSRSLLPGVCLGCRSRGRARTKWVHPQPGVRYPTFRPGSCGHMTSSRRPGIALAAEVSTISRMLLQLPPAGRLRRGCWDVAVVSAVAQCLTAACYLIASYRGT